MENRGTINWTKTKETIEEIQRISPGFTEGNCLIGGSAAWFYRTLLTQKKDRDFPAADYTEEEEKIWYSKDVDFIGTKKEELAKELQTTAGGEPPVVKINGVWVDTPDEGLFLTRNLAQKTAIEIQNTETGDIYKVTSATLLYREKKELAKLEKTLARPQDALHLRTLKQAAKLTICSLLEERELEGRKGKLAFMLIKEAQEIAPELLRDPKLLARLSLQLPRIGANPKTKALYHLLLNQVLPKGPTLNE